MLNYNSLFKNSILLFTFLITMLFSSCVESEYNKSLEIVQEWQGRQIIFPSNLAFINYANDTISKNVTSHDYTILVYVDSVGCTGCKMGLGGWSQFMSDIQSKDKNNDVEFLFFVHSNNIDEITSKMANNGFKHPVCIESVDSINILNNFPQDQRFQTFLLNKYNQVILIGNPLFSKGLYDLYMNQIFENSNSSKKRGIVVPEQIIITDSSIDGKYKSSFNIINLEDKPYEVKLKTSCECIEAFMSDSILFAHSEKTVYVSIDSEGEDLFFREIEVILDNDIAYNIIIEKLYD